MLLIPAVMTPLTYIAASADLPLQDTVLHAVDGALHLDWVAYSDFFYDRLRCWRRPCGVKV